MTMKPTPSSHDERIAALTFASIYPLYLAKVEKKGRTEPGDQMVDRIRQYGDAHTHQKKCYI